MSALQLPAPKHIRAWIIDEDGNRYEVAPKVVQPDDALLSLNIAALGLANAFSGMSAALDKAAGAATRFSTRLYFHGWFRRDPRPRGGIAAINGVKLRGQAS